MITTIDINADLGEGSPNDAAVMPLITSANIACGGHAGDDASMGDAIALAQRHGVGIGAHPSYPDRAGFGRREIDLPPADTRRCVREQVRALQRICRGAGASMSHVKPHGALYNTAARNDAVATAIVQAIADVDPSLIVVGLAGGRLNAVARQQGLATADEFFADRTYQPDGTLTPRTQPNAIHHDVPAAVKQVLTMLRDGRVLSIDGSLVPIRADTICLHGDGPEVVAMLTQLRSALDRHGIGVKGLRR